MGKLLTVIAGPNGSGKTTLAEEYLAEHAALYLGADAIAAELSPAAPQAARVAAGRQFLIAMRNAMQDESSLVVESTLSGKRFAQRLELARQQGFATTIAFLFLDSADTCVARVRERVRKGGHDVPEADVRRRFHRSISNFWNTYRFLSDDWALACNAGSDFQDVAFGLRDTVSVRSEPLFQQFMELVAQSEQ